MLNYQECEDLIFASYNRAAPTLTGYDSETRDLAIVRRLFTEAAIPFD